MPQLVSTTLQTVDIAAMLGTMLGGSWAAGLMMHLVNGAVICPAIFVYGLYTHLPGTAVMMSVAFGLVLWLVAQLVVMPMMGAGLFSSVAGGMMAAVGSLVGHLMYGVTLGAVVSAPAPRVAHA